MIKQTSRLVSNLNNIPFAPCRLVSCIYVALQFTTKHFRLFSSSACPVSLTRQNSALSCVRCIADGGSSSPEARSSPEN